MTDAPDLNMDYVELIKNAHITPIICNNCPKDDDRIDREYFIGTRQKENFAMSIAYMSPILSVGLDCVCEKCGTQAIHMYLIDPLKKHNLFERMPGYNVAKEDYPSMYEIDWSQ